MLLYMLKGEDLSSTSPLKCCQMPTHTSNFDITQSSGGEAHTHKKKKGMSREPILKWGEACTSHKPVTNLTKTVIHLLESFSSAHHLRVKHIIFIVSLKPFH